MAFSYTDSAQHLLQSYDAFLAGKEMDPKDTERFKAVCAAISFGSAAYEAGSGAQAAHAMGRSFLLALIDPLHPELDYLRADPKSGEVARLASSDLATIAAPKSETTLDGQLGDMICPECDHSLDLVTERFGDTYVCGDHICARVYIPIYVKEGSSD